MIERRVAAIYIRVSTTEQAEKGHSLDAQSDLLKKYAKQVGHEHYRMYRDAGFSGKDLNRPALQELLWDAYHHKFQELIVWRIDRLTRNTHDLLELIEYLKACCVILKSATEPFFDTTTPAGECILAVISSLAQMERDVDIAKYQFAREAGRWLV